MKLKMNKQTCKLTNSAPVNEQRVEEDKEGEEGNEQ